MHYSGIIPCGFSFGRHAVAYEGEPDLESITKEGVGARNTKLGPRCTDTRHRQGIYLGLYNIMLTAIVVWNKGYAGLPTGERAVLARSIRKVDGIG